MTFAPKSILDVRRLIQTHIPQLSAVELGIVGDDSHANSGTSYHLGEDALRSTSYSIVESPRDRAGLSDAASALDVGWFKITVKGKTHTLRDLSAWMVGQCRANEADTRDIREIIYSPDGETVKRWDKLGIRSSGDDSHLTHTHVSWFRDSENRDKTALFRRWFQHIGAIDTPEDDMTEAELIAAVTKALKGWSEENPLSTTIPKGEGRVGGWIRMMESRENDRADEVALRLNAQDAILAEIADAVRELRASLGK